MFDSKTYKVNIPEESCENCKFNLGFDLIVTNLLCGDESSTERVHQTGLCKNFESKNAKAITKKNLNNAK